MVVNVGREARSVNFHAIFAFFQRDHVDRKKWYEKTNAYNGDDGKPMAGTQPECDAAELLDDVESPMPNECTQEVSHKSEEVTWKYCEGGDERRRVFAGVSKRAV